MENVEDLLKCSFSSLGLELEILDQPATFLVGPGRTKCGVWDMAPEERGKPHFRLGSESCSLGCGLSLMVTYKSLQQTQNVWFKVHCVAFWFGPNHQFHSAIPVPKEMFSLTFI